MLAACSALAIGCDRPKSQGPGEASTPTKAVDVAKTQATLSERISRPPVDRIVAVGDLHGDIETTRRALRLGGAIDQSDAWIGGKLVVVQTGDEIDRGDDDRKILDLVEKLKDEAKKAGGELIAMSGNHELMNAAFDFRYVTPGGFSAFSDVTPKDADITARVASLDATQRGRGAAFAPGGPYAVMLADRPIVMKVGDNLFVHGGVLPKHVTYGLDKMNDEVRAWLLGKESRAPQIAVADDGPVWSRAYSAAPGKEECAQLDAALSSLGAKRMVMGHTVQRNGVTSGCDAKAWRVDVGLSHYYGGPVQVLEIKGDTVTVLKEGG